MRLNQADDLCIYCAERTATESEHVVARQFFPPEYRENLITVPSCNECNRIFQPHEEYLRLMFGANWEAGVKNPAARKIRDTKTLRVIQERDGLRRLLKRSVREAIVFNRGGHVLGVAPILDLDMSRAKIVCEKIVKGLLWDQYSVRLSCGYVIELWANITNECQSQLEQLLHHEPSQRARRMGGGVFTFRAGQGQEDPAQTIWLCSFYDTFYFAATTGPAEIMERFRRQFGGDSQEP